MLKRFCREKRSKDNFLNKNKKKSSLLKIVIGSEGTYMHKAEPPSLKKCQFFLK